MGRLRQLFCKHDYNVWLMEDDKAKFTCKKCRKQFVTKFKMNECRLKEVLKDWKRKCKLVKLQEIAIKNNKLFAINTLKELQLQVSEDKTNIDKLIKEKIDYLEKGESSGRKITK